MNPNAHLAFAAIGPGVIRNQFQFNGLIVNRRRFGIERRIVCMTHSCISVCCDPDDLSQHFVRYRFRPQLAFARQTDLIQTIAIVSLLSTVNNGATRV